MLADIVKSPGEETGGWAIPSERKIDERRLNARRRAASQPKSFLLFPILLTASKLPHFVCGARYWFDALASKLCGCAPRRIVPGGSPSTSSRDHQPRRVPYLRSAAACGIWNSSWSNAAFLSSAEPSATQQPCRELSCRLTVSSMDNSDHDAI